MSAAKHTPGPWQTGAGKYGNVRVEEERDGSNRYVAEVSSDNPNQAADAALIAAAPDLVGALENLVEAQRSGMLVLSEHAARTGHDYVTQARAAIAKARGKS